MDAIAYCLSHDLACEKEILAATHARELARAFLSGFGGEVQFLTNSRRFLKTSDSNQSYGFEPISHATFDSGVLVDDRGVVGILWVEDED